MAMPLYECMGVKSSSFTEGEVSQKLRFKLVGFFGFVFFVFVIEKNMTIDWSYFLKNILQVLNNREWNLTFPLTALCLLIKILQFLLSKILDFVLFHES